jgi:hypothetical protein
MLGYRGPAQKRDPIEFRQVPLPRSVINKIARELKIEKAYDKPVTDKEWPQVNRPS